MKEFFELNSVRLISTIILILLLPTIRLFFNKILNRYAVIASLNSTRTMMMKKSVNFLVGAVCIFIIIAIWGVEPKNIFLALSSIFAVIGVALFAQWSIISNITAGFILFFSLRLKIGDKIRIVDKDFPFIAEVEDLKTFYIHLRGEDGERIVYPNNLLLQKGISIFPDKKDKIEIN